LKQVTDHLKLKIRQRLTEVCEEGGNEGLSCDVADLEAICEEVKMEMMESTNEIFKKRRKRGM
jgi:ribosomal protein S3AE